MLSRLRRAEGHLSSVIPMIESGRDGLEIVQQMQAVIRALEKTKQALILDHVDHRLADLAGQSAPEHRKAISDMREIVKYL